MDEQVKLLSRWTGVGVACVLAAIGGCSRPSGPPKNPTGPPKHLVLIVVDTLRADVLGCYGGEAATPNIDGLAAEGVRFETARSHIPITGPSHLSLFTSLLPLQHGVHNNTDLVPGGIEPMAEILARSGFATTGVVSLGVLQSRFGFSRGFERYDDRSEGRFWRDAIEVNEVALPLLDCDTGRRQFFFFHFSDPHSPYSSPDADLPSARFFLDGTFVAETRLDGRRFSIPIRLPPGETELEVKPSHDDGPRRVILRRLKTLGGECRIEAGDGVRRSEGDSTSRIFYGSTPLKAVVENPSSETIDGELVGTIEFTPEKNEIHRYYQREVEFVDRQIGRLIAALRSKGIWQDSLVVFVADHGEGLGDFGRFAHADHLYDVTLRVPLILVAPGRLDPGQVVPTAVRLIDVLPTVLEMLGVVSPADMAGETLLPLLESAGPDRVLVAMTFGPQAKHDRRALVAGGFKYIWTVDNGARELFDLANDPREIDNLADQETALADAMHEELLRALADRRADTPAERAELSREESEGLEALGYVH